MLDLIHYRYILSDILHIEIISTYSDRIDIERNSCIDSIVYVNHG